MELETQSLIITQHAKERYAERIMGRENTREINVYVSEESEKIHNDILKMVTYGEEIYYGILNKKEKEPTHYILCGTWVIILDKGMKKVITLYKIDLNVDEDFNKEFVSRMKEKIDKSKEKLNMAETQLKEEENVLDSHIEEVDAMIKKRKNEIKMLEEAKVGYEESKKALTVSRTECEDELRDVVASLICKREF